MGYTHYWTFTDRPNKSDYDSALKECARDISGEVLAVLEMCEALTCSNVKIDTLQECNKKVNAKRIKKGKLPIYETKVLSLDFNKSRSLIGRQVSDRASPRQHLRRGHIRNINDDKRIWVNSCIVGSSELGKIDKSYNLKWTT